MNLFRKSFISKLTCKLLSTSVPSMIWASVRNCQSRFRSMRICPIELPKLAQIFKKFVRTQEKFCSKFVAHPAYFSTAITSDLKKKKVYAHKRIFFYHDFHRPLKTKEGLPQICATFIARSFPRPKTK